MTTAKSKKSQEHVEGETSSFQESFKVNGEHLLSKVKEIIKEGNVRKIIIKDKHGKSLIEFPLTIGVVGAVIAPVLAAVGAIAALVSECTITVVREKETV
jgi:hypothetical protein